MARQTCRAQILAVFLVHFSLLQSSLVIASSFPPQQPLLGVVGQAGLQIQQQINQHIVPGLGIPVPVTPFIGGILNHPNILLNVNAPQSQGTPARTTMSSPKNPSSSSSSTSLGSPSVSTGPTTRPNVINQPFRPYSPNGKMNFSSIPRILRRRNRKGKMIREFLFEHNKIRMQMREPALVWDRKLARYAERYAHERKIDCSLKHSTDGPYGENIYCGQHFERHSASMAVRAWVGENAYYHLDTRTCDSNKICGHYTQIIWRNSKRVGCARVKCNSGGVFIICVYDPPGNYKNEDPLTSKD